GWPSFASPWAATGVFILECLLMVLILSSVSAIYARLRIDQLAGLGWRILVPLALLQLGFVVLMGV
ncbi:MAG: NADH-quinone oxidoreductase subunit H, partial [Brevefilum sp.]